MDSQIVELRTIADRDFQLDEKAIVAEEEKAHDEFYDRLWHEGYLAKIEREEREKELKRERNVQQKATLGVQVEMRDNIERVDREVEKTEAEEMLKLWTAQEKESKEAVV